MTAHDDGGPAFPVTATGYTPEPGMTLRDYFAGQAITLAEDLQIEEAEVILGEELPPFTSDAEVMAFRVRAKAALSYRVADAMLAARRQTDGVA